MSNTGPALFLGALASVTIIVTVAILRYSVDEVSKVWEMIEPLVAIAVGGTVVYQFNKKSVIEATKRADTAEQLLRKNNML